MNKFIDLLLALKSISIPCFPISQSKGWFARSKLTSKETPTCKSCNSLREMGLNLESFKAAMRAYLDKFFSKESDANVPMQPLRSFSGPLVHVTKRGKLF